jgi:hypothetical protein
MLFTHIFAFNHRVWCYTEVLFIRSYVQIWTKSNTTDATHEAGTAYPEFTSSFSGFRVDRCLSLFLFAIVVPTKFDTYVSIYTTWFVHWISYLSISKALRPFITENGICRTFFVGTQIVFSLLYWYGFKLIVIYNKSVDIEFNGHHAFLE